MRCRDCYKETGSASPRCDACKEKAKARWQAWIEAGKCPRCEEHRDLVPGAQSCYECGFGVEDGDDYVDPLFDGDHPRLAKKWLRED